MGTCLGRKMPETLYWKVEMGRLLCLLDGCDRELLCTTAGVLINLMADWDKRLAFKQDGGASR
ncbi:unnamed protein product [Timema podura]|uniref:Uncharacterized protein n=1 Tax=Timema podura TaxID=61482 RepID=A0ABN7P926_TIMPD|nr:unnamed protein product [Timema podura]